VADEIDVEMCSYGQLSEVQMFRDLDLDFGSGQGHNQQRRSFLKRTGATYVW